jgi:5'-nucleotidase
MRILCTNDDGILGEGLNLLRRVAEDFAEVYVIAPDRERSAASHAITLDAPLRAEDVGPRAFALNGTPVDCVWVGVNKLLGEVRPDLIISGINRGANLGSDVIYSGTVAAAIEGSMKGIPSMALSFVGGPDYPFDALEEPVRQVLTRFTRELPPSDTVYNVNFPHPSSYNGTPEIVATSLGERFYSQEVVVREDPRGKSYFWVGGSESTHSDIPGSDCNAIRDGQISVTPISMNFTNQAVLSRLRAEGSNSDTATITTGTL